MNPAVVYQSNAIHHWVVQSACQAGSPHDFPPSPPLSCIESNGDTEIHFDDDESTSGSDQTNPSIPYQQQFVPASKPYKRKREEHSDDEQDEGRARKMRSVRSEEEGYTEDTGTVRDFVAGGQGKEAKEEDLNKRDFRVILIEILGQTQLIKADIANGSQDEDLRLARIRLKTMKGFLEVAIDRLSYELAQQLDVEPNQEELDRE